MTLDQFLRSSKFSVEEFALKIGVTSEAVRRYRSGRRMPEPLIAQRIVDASKGRVTIQDLHEVRVAHLRSTEAA